LTWYSYYCLEESQRIDALKREVDALDQAMLVAYAVNSPKQLDERRKALRQKMRGDAPALAPKFTKQEMTDAVQRLMAKNWKTAKVIPS
jgi:hypothetical protein